MTDPASWRPHGRALLDFCNGDTSAEIVVNGDDGETEVVPIRVFFRGPSEFSALEEAALDLCRGRVLDAGAGAGCHTLVLQEQDCSVCAIDIAPEAVEVMRRRGVKEARCADVFHFREGPFDTLLLMMNGIGVVEDLAGLDRFLADAHRLLTPEGHPAFNPMVDSSGRGRPELSVSANGSTCLQPCRGGRGDSDPELSVSANGSTCLQPENTAPIQSFT